MSRSLNQNVQKYLTERNYHNLIQTVETYFNKYPLSTIAQQAVVMVKNIIPYCDGKLLDYIMMSCEWLQITTHDYHYINLHTLPVIKFYTKKHQLIYTSLQTGSPDIEYTKQYFFSGQDCEEFVLVNVNYLIKIQEVAPNLVHKFHNRSTV